MLWLFCTNVALAAPHWSDAPPMTAPPAEIRAAAAEEVAALAVEGDAKPPDVHILLDETSVLVNDDGSWRLQRRMVFQPLTSEAATAWGTWLAPWDTWRESRPGLSARVMQADGDVYTLDPALVAEGSAGADPLLLTDSKALQAPLPQIEANAIVEQVLTIEHVDPLLPGQFFLNTYLERNDPVERMVVHIDAPRAMKLHTALMEVDQELVHKKKGERQLLDLVLLDARPVPPMPAAAPRDLPRYRALYVSSAPDWASVAQSYQRMVASKLDPAGLEALSAPLAGLSRDTLIATALDEVLAGVRYTGVLFGQTRIVPNLPSETLLRGFGDCKDQASLLVALLNAAGVPANLALLNASTADDLPSDVPSMSYFDHAIVFVPGPVPRWIDPTQPYASSVFPPGNIQGRLALIIAPDTTALTRIPRSAAADSVWSEELTFTLPYRGRGSAVEDVEATGWISALTRNLYQQLGGDEQASLIRRAETVLDTHVVRAANVTPWSALQTVWRSHIEAEDLGTASATVTGGVVKPWVFHGAADLPPSLLTAMAPEGKRYALQFTPYRYHMTLKVKHPIELEPQILAEQNSFAAGDVRIEREVSLSPGLVTITVSLDAGAGFLSAVDADRLREILLKFEPWPSDGIVFVNTAMAHLAEGDAAGAMPLLRASAAAHPEDPARRTDLVRAEVALGLMDAARRDLAPVRDRESAEVRYAEAAVLARDPYGRFLRGRFDRAGAIKAARSALAIDPEHDDARDLLIALLERNEEGAWLAEGSDPCGAADALAAYVVDRGDNTRAEEFIQISLRCDDHSALQEWLGTVNGTAVTGARVALEALDKGAAATIKGMSDRGELRRDWAGASKGLFMLVDLARYDLALGLADQARPLLAADEQVRLDKTRTFLAGLEKGHTRPAALDDPEGAIIAAFRASGSGRAAELEPFVASGYGSASARAQLLRYCTLGGPDTSARMLADTLIGMSAFTAEGDKATGYRVTWKLDSAEAQRRSQIFLIPGKGRLLVLTEGGHMGPVGAYAAELARKGDTKAAMTWLGWAQDGTNPSSARAPLERTPWLHLLRLADPTVPASVEAAGLALALDREATDALYDRLEAIRGALPGAEHQVQLDRAAIVALGALERPEPALAVVDRLLLGFPDEPSLVIARLGLVTYVDPEAAARQLAALDPAQHGQERMDWISSSIAVQRRDYLGAVATMAPSAERGGLSAMNHVLWYELFLDERPADLGERADRLAKALGPSDISRIHTVAAVEAATDSQVSAAARLMNALDQGWVDDDDLGHWWLVRGLICEAVGETDLAIAAYRAVQRYSNPAEDLGLHRLQALGATP